MSNIIHINTTNNSSSNIRVQLAHLYIATRRNSNFIISRDKLGDSEKMAAVVVNNGSVTDGWSKWQIALAVGAPMALGAAGFWYYKKRNKPRSRNRNGLAGDKSGIDLLGKTDKVKVEVFSFSLGSWTWSWIGTDHCFKHCHYSLCL